MKSLLPVMAVVACLGLPAWGQNSVVSVEITLDQEQFLAHEALNVAVRVANFSGRTLKLGDQPDWLRLSVQSDNGLEATPLGTPPVLGEFELPTASRGTRRVDIAPYFTIEKLGRYQVTAVVRIPDLNLEVTSPPKRFNIVGGTKFWEQNFGLPASGTGDRAVEIRKYALVQALHANQTELYFRLSDASDERVFKVFPLGVMLAFSDPEMRLDRQSSLHLLFQMGARNFTYDVLRPNGELMVRQLYQYTTSRPTLRVKEDGTVKVVGGIRLRNRLDLPVDEPEPEDGATSAPPASSTNSPPVAPSPGVTNLPASTHPPAPPALPARP
jgi:hypothetical protein